MSIGDIAQLGLEIRSADAVEARNNLRGFNHEAKLSEAAAASLRRAWLIGMAAMAAGTVAFGAAVSSAVRRIEEMERSARQVDRALANTGNTARTSAREIEAWADTLEARTGRAAEDVMAVAANLASFGFGRSEFFRSLELANDMAAAWGGDLRQNLEGLARALDDPLNGMAMLSRRGIQLSDEQKALAEAFLNANDKIGAQGVVLDALEAQVAGVAEAGFGGLSAAMARAQKVWEDAFESLVRGDNATADLRDTIISLAETISSPEFVGAVMDFGGVLLNVINGLAQAAIFAMDRFREFRNFLTDGMPVTNTAAAGNDTLQARLSQLAADQQALREQEIGLQQRLQNPGWVDGLLGNPQTNATLLGDIPAQREALQREAQRIMAEIDRRSVSTMPPAFDFTTTVNPYEGGDFTTDDRRASMAAQVDAYAQLTRGANEFIAAQQLEAEAFGMTEFAANRYRHEQDLLNQAANDNLSISPLQREEIAALAESMAQAQLQVAGAQLQMSQQGPFETLGMELARLDEMLQSGAINWQTYANAATQSMAGTAAGVLGLAGQASGALAGLFGESKEFAVANAVINTAEGITKALATYGPTPWGFAAAGVAAATGAAQIAAIMSAQKGSGSVSRPGAAPSQPAAAANEGGTRTAINVTLQGSNFSDIDVEALIRTLNDGMADGMVLNVNRAA